jgi:hypothetical protein
MDAPTRGPFTITAAHNNGAVAINHGRITETINICRIKPYILSFLAFPTPSFMGENDMLHCHAPLVTP